jgi:hypothetical protein
VGTNTVGQPRGLIPLAEAASRAEVRRPVISHMHEELGSNSLNEGEVLGLKEHGHVLLYIYRLTHAMSEFAG